MKLRTEKGKFIISDGEREINFDTDGDAAFAYVFVMAQIRPVPYTTPALHPVRSLVPHPKKIRITKKWREKIKKIKNYLSTKKFDI